MRAYLIRKRDTWTLFFGLSSYYPELTSNVYESSFPLLVQTISSFYYEMQIYKKYVEVTKKIARNILFANKTTVSFCGEKIKNSRPEAIRLRQWFCSVVSAWQIARKRKERERERETESREYRYICTIPGAEFKIKIHVNIIRLAVHFLRLGARTSRGSSYDERAWHENRRFDIFGCWPSSSTTRVIRRERAEARTRRRHRAHLASHISVRGFRSYPLLPPIVNGLPAHTMLPASFTFRWHRGARALWEKRDRPRITYLTWVKKANKSQRLRREKRLLNKFRYYLFGSNS